MPPCEYFQPPLDDSGSSNRVVRRVPTITYDETSDILHIT